MDTDSSPDDQITSPEDGEKSNLTHEASNVPEPVVIASAAQDSTDPMASMVTPPPVRNTIETSVPFGDTPAPTLTRCIRGLGLLSLIGASIGLCAGTLVVAKDLAAFINSNQIGVPARKHILYWMFGTAFGFLSLGGFSLIYAFFARKLSRAGILEDIARFLSPLCLIGFFPFLFHWRLWHGKEMTFLVMVGLFSLSAWVSIRSALISKTRLPKITFPQIPFPRIPFPKFLRRIASVLPWAWRSLRARRWGWLPLPLVLLGSAGYAILFSIFTVTFHRNLRTAAYDLGLEDNLVWNVLHGFGFFRSTPFCGPTGSHFGNHATFFSYVIAPIYALWQHATTLLVIQSVVIGAAAIPLFLFARLHVSAWLACLIAYAYLLYPPVHGANLYEFHYLPLGAFFLWFSLYFLETRRNIWATIAIVLTLSVREDVGAGLAIIGAFLLLTGRRPKAGLIVAAIGTLHFCLLKLVFMPLVAGHESFTGMYKDLLPPGQDSYSGMLKTVFGNPFFTLNTLIERDKLLFLLNLFVPLAFLPLRKPIILLLIVPGFFFTLLSTQYFPLIQISFQYTFHWTVFLFIALVFTLTWISQHSHVDDRIRRIRLKACVVALVAASLPSSYQIGAVFQQNTARGGFIPFNFKTTEQDLLTRAAFKKIIVHLPPRASVAASDNLVAQISNRPNAYSLRIAIFDAEYLLFWTKMDRIDGDERNKVASALLSSEFGVLNIEGPIAIARRGHATTLNNFILEPWGQRMPSPPDPPKPPPQ